MSKTMNDPIAAFSFAPHKGGLLIEGGMTKVHVLHEDIPVLLYATLNALRTAGFSDDQLDACAKACRVHLGRFLK